MSKASEREAARQALQEESEAREASRLGKTLGEIHDELVAAECEARAALRVARAADYGRAAALSEQWRRAVLARVANPDA